MYLGCILKIDIQILWNKVELPNMLYYIAILESQWMGNMLVIRYRNT